MRILHILDTLDRHAGRWSNAMPRLLDALAAIGHRSDVVAGASHDTLTGGALQADTVAVVDEDDANGALGTIAPLAGRADWVHIHAPDAYIGTIAAAAARSSGSPILVSTHGALTRSGATRSRVYLWLENRRFHKKYRGAWLHADTPIEADWLQRRGLACDVPVIRVGAPTPLSPDDGAGANPVELPWRDERRLCACLEDIDVRLGAADLIDAWIGLGEAMSGWRLVLAGRPIDDTLERLQRAIDASDRTAEIEIIVYPEVSQQAALLDGAAFTIGPAPIPTSPISALTALSAGKPVLLTPMYGLDSVGGQAGRVIDPGFTSLRDGLAAMLRMESDSLARMGKEAAQFVQEDHGWGECAAGLDALYRSA